MARRPRFPWAARPDPTPRPPVIQRPGLPYTLDAHWPARLSASAVAELGASPASGQPLGAGVKLFHDAGALNLRVETSDDALQLETLAFDGSFLSLVIDLPPDLLAGLAQDHLLGLHVCISAAPGTTCYARLNIHAGPNSATDVEQLPTDPAQLAIADFGVDRMRLDLTRIEAAWLDLIVEAPLPPRLSVSNLALTRRHRPRF